MRQLTVREHLLLGAFSRRWDAAARLAGTLSGGDQQMLVIGRGGWPRPPGVVEMKLSHQKRWVRSLIAASRTRPKHRTRRMCAPQVKSDAVALDRVIDLGPLQAAIASLPRQP